jgi:hypothetical protein
MRRILILLGAGIAIGTIAAYYYPPRDGRTESPFDARTDQTGSSSTQALQEARRLIGNLIAAPGSDAERAARDQLAALHDGVQLESLVQEVVAFFRAAPGRRAALEVLLSRYAQLNPGAAIRVAHGFGLEPELRAPLYEQWAQARPRTAPDDLRAVEDPTLALEIALELLRVVGNDERGIARIVTALPTLDQQQFRIEAIVARAGSDPSTAFEDALELTSSTRSAVLERVATIWATHNVHEALRRAALIADAETSALFRSALLREWALTAPDAMLSYISDLDPATQREALATGGWQAFAEMDPIRALEVTERLPGQVATIAQRAALLNVASSDPLAALAYAERLPAGPERDDLLAVVATGYGRKDPEAALAWAQNLQPPSPAALANVLSGLVRVDPERAIDVALAIAPANQQMPALQKLVVSDASAGAAHAGVIGSRLLDSMNSQTELLLRTLASEWVRKNPDEALEWLLANGDRVPPRIFAHIGRQLGHANPDVAGAYTSRIPGVLRSTWIGAVADGHARADPAAAANWVAQYQGQPGYDAAVAAIARRLSRQAPAAGGAPQDSAPADEGR